MLKKIRRELVLDYPGLRVLCPTGWTVWAESLESILDNLVALECTWDESFEENLVPELRRKIIGVKSQMSKVDYFYGVNVLHLVLRNSDTVSKISQNSKITEYPGKKIAYLTLQTIKALRSEYYFYLMLEKIMQEADLDLELSDHSLTRECKRAFKLISVNKTRCYDDVTGVKTFYRCIYFNATDTVVNCIEGRFSKPEYKASQHTEMLFLNVVNLSNYDKQLEQLLLIYENEVNQYSYSTQLEVLKTFF